MANTAAALKWLNDHRSRFGFRIRLMEGTRKAIPVTVFDYEISFKHGVQSYIGRGIDSSESLAVVKALAECLERYCCAIHGVSSSGVAAHFSIREGRDHALRELIEHDILSVFMLAGIEPEILTDQSLERQVLPPNGLEFRQYCLRHYPHLPVVVTLAIHDQTSVSIGLGCDVNITKAANKSLRESLPNAAFFLISGNKFEHQLDRWLARAKTPPPQAAAGPECLVEFEKLSIDFDNPFKFCRATSFGMQGYLPTGWTSIDVNFDRVACFGGLQSPLPYTQGVRLF